jgi:hypothetical protein
MDYFHRVAFRSNSNPRFGGGALNSFEAIGMAALRGASNMSREFGALAGLG